MAAKPCPGCRKQVPVACKKCGCGHSFFAARRPAGKAKKDDAVQKKEKAPPVVRPSASVSVDTKVHSPVDAIDIDEDIPLATLRQLKHGETDLPRRRTGRVQREKPNFYDALEYDNQMRRKMRLLKRKCKSEEGIPKPSETQSPSSIVEVPTKEVRVKSTEVVPQAAKKRRGRPPRLTNTTKVVKVSKPTVSLPLNNKVKQPKEPNPASIGDYHEDLMKGITPEKALQCTTILADINRKWVTVSWRI